MDYENCPRCGNFLNFGNDPAGAVAHLSEHLRELAPEVADVDQLVLEVEETKRLERSLDDSV